MSNVKAAFNALRAGTPDDIEAAKEILKKETVNQKTWSELLDEVVGAARLAELEACVEYLDTLHQSQNTHIYYRLAAAKLLAARGPK